MDRLVGATNLGDDEVLEDEADDQQLSKAADRSRPSPPARAHRFILALGLHSKLISDAKPNYERPERPAPVGERVFCVG